MPFVAELYFDPSTKERIRDAWKAIDAAGISDSMPKGGLPSACIAWGLRPS